ncbi:hypothetical protein [uncultured Enterococcus sp.]|uniref:hypothetical protein n=1 Tax=uncultured Enterococcus sp. TaxID=167972 RepID=UPI002AA94070|nr:hypothetical protein [uncultured Enterococcus sp.]
MRKGFIYIKVLFLFCVLSGCTKEEQQISPSEQKTDTYSISESDQSTAQSSVDYSFDSDGVIDVPKGSLSEDNPIFDSTEENTFVGEVLKDAKSSEKTALVTVKINGGMQEFYIVTDGMALKKGQIIKIRTNGIILETYPTSFAEIFSIEVIQY